MKYKINTSIVILIFSFIALSCSNNPALRYRYQTEKKYYACEKALKTAQSFHNPLTQKQIKELTPQYKELLGYCYLALDSVDSNQNPVEYNELKYLTHQSATRLSQMYYSNKQFGQCVNVLNQLLEKVNLSDMLLATTYINLGQAIQSSGNWDSALTVYNYTLKKFYPPINKSQQIIFTIFNLPIHIFHVDQVLGDSVATRYAFTRAEKYYQKLIDEYPQTKLSTASHSNLARLYDDTRQWKKEIKELTTIADPTKPSYQNIQIKIADIYGGHLKKFDTALAIYQSNLDRTKPEDSLIKSGLMLKICLVKMKQKKYSAARKLLNDIKKQSYNFFNSNPLLQYTLARSYELDGKWNRAETEYNLLFEKYFGSDEAMMTYLYLVDKFHKAKREKEFQKWFQEAEQYLDKVASKNTGNPVEAKALLYKAKLYKQVKQWQKAVDILQAVYQKFPNVRSSRQGIVDAAYIYKIKLHNPAKSDSLLNMLRSSLSKIDTNNNKDLYEK